MLYTQISSIAILTRKESAGCQFNDFKLTPSGHKIMNTLKYTSLIVIGLLLSATLNESKAQILKKIKKRTQDKVENVIINKTSDKAAEIASKNMDKMLSADFNPYGGGEKKAEVSDLPDSYTFEWKYQLKMNTEHPKMKDDLVFDYYLASDQPYFGYAMEQMRSMFTVIDMKKEVSISYMEQEGTPMALAYKLPGMKADPESEDGPEFTVTELPSKTFLGYESKGLQMENSEQRIIMYIATDVPVGFTNMYNAANGKNNIPESFKNLLNEQGHALMMYGKIIDKDDPKKNIEMECISLEETIMVKNNGNYTFM